MSSPHIVYRPRPDATPEGEVTALADVYSFVLRCGEARRVEGKKKAAGPGGPNDAEESKNARTAEPEYNR